MSDWVWSACGCIACGSSTSSIGACGCDAWGITNAAPDAGTRALGDGIAKADEANDAGGVCSLCACGCDDNVASVGISQDDALQLIASERCERSDVGAPGIATRQLPDMSCGSPRKGGGAIATLSSLTSDGYGWVMKMMLGDDDNGVFSLDNYGYSLSSSLLSSSLLLSSLLYIISLFSYILLSSSLLFSSLDDDDDDRDDDDWTHTTRTWVEDRSGAAANNTKVHAPIQAQTQAPGQARSGATPSCDGAAPKPITRKTTNLSNLAV